MHRLFDIADIHYHRSSCILDELKELPDAVLSASGDDAQSLMARFGV